MNRKFLSVITWCVLVIVVSCNGGSEVEKKQVLDAIKQYNLLLKRTYLEANLDLMGSIVTEKQMNRLYPFIIELRAKNNTMICDQKQFEVKNISVKREKATITTEETWVYFRVNVNTGEITEPEKTEHYEILYTLVNENGNWKVDSLEPIE